MNLLQLIDEDHISDVLDNPDYTAWIEQTRSQINLAREQIARGDIQSLDAALVHFGKA